MDNATRARCVAAAAALLVAAAGGAAEPAETVRAQCMGVNACKQRSACATPRNRCAGQNACRGQGFLMLTPAECTAAKARLGKAEPPRP